MLLRCSHTDVSAGMWRLEVVPEAQQARYEVQHTGSSSYDGSSEY